MAFDIHNFAGVGFNQSEYILRESVMNHTIPVRITGGRLPIDTSVQVHTEVETAGTCMWNFLCTYMYLQIIYFFYNISYISVPIVLLDDCFRFLTTCVISSFPVIALVQNSLYARCGAVETGDHIIESCSGQFRFLLCN